jgi:predicted ATPase/DNA-binding winged helix-turn-helix (wHTH) protein
MDLLRLSGTVVDLARGEVVALDGRKRLTSREAELLAYLARRPGEPVSRDELHTEVWGMSPSVQTRAVDFTLHRLRGKIERNPAEPRHLLKVHGVGYKLVIDADEAPGVQDATVLAARIDRLALRWRHDPQGTEAAVRALRERVLQTSEALGGTPVRTQPPLVVFPTASAGLAAALRLVDSELPCALALATGEVGYLSEQGTVRGQIEACGWTVERAQLLAGSFQPGHVVLDEQTAAQLGPAGARVGLRDLGEQVLAEVPEKLRIWEARQLAPDGAGRVVGATNLWRYADVRVGREALLDQLAQQLEAQPVVALWGPGGVGKSRVARELGLAWLARGRAPGGVWWCDLRGATNADEVLVAAAEPTALPSDRHRAARMLAGRGPCLLVFDTSEHVLADVLALVRHWAEQAPEARFLLTTRARPEGVPVLAVAPLDRAQAAELLLARASAVRPGFPREDPAAVDELADRLQGLPLAIELVAARARLSTARQLLHSLREADEQLMSTVEWSYRQLTPPQRHLLRALSLYVGSFSLDEVPELDGDPTELVAALRDLALMTDAAGSADMNLILYDLVRAFALARLQESPDRAELEARHRERVLSRAERQLAAFGTWSEPAALRRVREDLPDLLAVVNRAREAGDRSTWARGVAVLGPVLGRLGPRTLLKALTEPLLPDAEQHPTPVALGLLRTAWMVLRGEGRVAEAHEALQRCMVVAHQAGDEVQERLAEGRLLSDVEPTETREPRLAAVCERLAALGAPGPAGVVATELANGLVMRGQLERAVRWYERVLALQRLAGDRRGEAVALTNQASLLRNTARWEEAAALARSAWLMLRECGDDRNAAMAQGVLGTALVGMGALAEGLEILQRTLQEARHGGSEPEEVAAGGSLGDARLLAGDAAGARQVLGESLALARSVGLSWWSEYQSALMGCVRAMEGDREGGISELLRASRHLERLQSGVAWTWRATAAVLLSLEGRPDEARAELALIDSVPAEADSGESLAAVRAAVHDGDLQPIRSGRAWMLQRLRAVIPPS